MPHRASTQRQGKPAIIILSITTSQRAWISCNCRDQLRCPHNGMAGLHTPTQCNMHATQYSTASSPNKHRQSSTQKHLQNAHAEFEYQNMIPIWEKNCIQFWKASKDKKQPRKGAPTSKNALGHNLAEHFSKKPAQLELILKQ